jgi:uncharacterized Zn finger protein (UPF0148 family)
VITELHRTLEQELNALLRGISYECLACGEFVMHAHGSIFCPECGFRIELQQAAGAEVSRAG